MFAINLKQIIIIILLFAAQAAADNNSTINITANSNTFDHSKGTIIYIENVELIQDDLQLNAARLEVYQDDNGNIIELIATGKPAKLKNLGKAETIKFYPEQDKLIFIGKATVTSNNDLISGEYITYFLNTGKLIAKSIKNKKTTITIFKSLNDESTTSRKS